MYLANVDPTERESAEADQHDPAEKIHSNCLLWRLFGLTHTIYEAAFTTLSVSNTKSLARQKPDLTNGRQKQQPRLEVLKKFQGPEAKTS